ncbi:MAG: dTDP-glucose 4,6-dehydratase [Hyphomonadaceae bacterium]|nr:dTDP-glucose 4,6-dehydratase [Hyphomonadaceae bacterium]
MMKALVTGAAGFIGSALCKALIARGWQVTGFDAMTYAAHRGSLEPELSAGQMQLIEANICDGRAVSEALAHVEPDCLFHLAAESHVDRSIDGPETFLDTNIDGTFTLLQAARTLARRKPAFRFVHVSTDEVFGELGADGMFSETSAYAPRSPYAASKAASDHLVRAWQHSFELPVLITNCCNNFGPRQFPEKLIPLMVLKALRGEAMPVYGAGEQVRDWLHVEDHALALITVAERGTVGETYLVGANQELRNIDLVRQIAAMMDERRPEGAPHARLITHVEDRPGHDFRYAIDASKLRTELGWTPQIEFETGLAATVDWYLENRDWWQPILDGTYRGERLGLAT